jgi:hypothetical protein
LTLLKNLLKNHHPKTKKGGNKNMRIEILKEYWVELLVYSIMMTAAAFIFAAALLLLILTLIAKKREKK